MPSLRERQSASTRADIAAAALSLFMDLGFGATTIDRIVEEAGVSRRTFFHHFATKEDAALGDLDGLGQGLLQALEARPADEPAWTALGEALRSLNGGIAPATQLALAELYASTPSLRARHLEKHLHWQDLLAPEIERRLRVEAGDYRARAVIAASLACLDVAVEAWRASGGRADLEQLYRDAASAIRT